MNFLYQNSTVPFTHWNPQTNYDSLYIYVSTIAAAAVERSKHTHTLLLTGFSFFSRAFYGVFRIDLDFFSAKAPNTQQIENLLVRSETGNGR